MIKNKIKGLKMTPQRLAILAYLEGNIDHPSADDIYKAVLKKFPTMSFATVYNTLESLKNRGSVSELTIDPDKKRFDPNPDPHNHLICNKCRKILDIHIDYELRVPYEKKQGFEITGNHIKFYGICPKCRRGK
ncbi:MAG: transcriptional repressor [Nitrospira sp.]|nr:transcriptional repressor [Nitrospira sp.]